MVCWTDCWLQPSGHSAVEAYRVWLSLSHKNSPTNSTASAVTNAHKAAMVQGGREAGLVSGVLGTGRSVGLITELMATGTMVVCCAALTCCRRMKQWPAAVQKQTQQTCTSQSLACTFLWLCVLLTLIPDSAVASRDRHANFGACTCHCFYACPSA